jgi:phosphoserine phosphatase
MGGDVLFQDALAARLDLIQPSQQDLTAYLAKYPVKLTPGVKELVDLLHQRGKAVYLVSGGFRQVRAGCAGCCVQAASLLGAR